MKPNDVSIPLSLGTTGLAYATGVAVSSGGAVFIADTGNNAIKQLVGNALYTIGSSFSGPQGVAVSTTGTVYVADTGDNAVKQIIGGVITVVASGFNGPRGVAAGGSNVYVADTGNSAVKVIAPGKAPVALPAPSGGYTRPTGVAVDASGNVYVADAGSKMVWKIPFAASVYGAPIQVGSGQPFASPTGVAVDSVGTVYVTDTGNNSLFQFIRGGSSASNPITGLSSPAGVAVSAGSVFVANTGNNQILKEPVLGGTVTVVALGSLVVNGDIAVDQSRNLYFANAGTVPCGGTIYKLTAGGILTVVAAGRAPVATPIPSPVPSGATPAPAPPCPGAPGNYGFLDFPRGVAVDSSPVPNVYVADAGENIVWKIPPSPGASPIAIGSGFNDPLAVAVDARGNTYVADNGNNVVKKMKPGGAPTVLANIADPWGVAADTSTPSPNIYVVTGGSGQVFKIAPKASPSAIPGNWIEPVAVAAGPSGGVYVADQANNTVYRISPNGTGVTAVGTVQGPPVGVAVATNGNIYVGSCCFIWNISRVSNSTAVFSSKLPNARGIAIDGSGNVYVSTSLVKSTVWKIPPAGGLGLPMPSPAAGYMKPFGLAASASGTIYVADTFNSAVEMIANGKVTTIGSGFLRPYGVAVDAKSNVYVADFASHAVRMISGNVVTTIGYGFATPTGVAVPPGCTGKCTVYVSDPGTYAVYKVAGGVVTRIGPLFQYPTDLTVDASGNVYVVDLYQKSLTKIDPAGKYALLGSGFSQPWGVAIQKTGSLLVTDVAAGVVYHVLQ
jgi:sugar lactone lactonase YvrE